MSDSGRKTPFREKGRLEVDWEVRVLPVGGKDDPVLAKVTDIGMGGASLVGPLSLSEGATVQLEMRPSGMSIRTLTLPSVVRWIKAASSASDIRVGVAFEGLTPAQTAELAEVLSCVPQVLDLEE